MAFAVAQVVLTWQIEQLDLLLHPRPRETSPSAPRVDTIRAIMWNIVVGLLVLMVLCFLFATLDPSPWSSEKGTSISRRVIGAWIGAAAAVAGVVLYALITALGKVKRGKAVGVRATASGNVPIGKIQEAAQRVETAKRNALAAQKEVDSVQALVNTASGTQRVEAEGTLSNAAASATFQRELQFEEKQLAFVTEADRNSAVRIPGR